MEMQLRIWKNNIQKFNIISKLPDLKSTDINLLRRLFTK